MLTMIKFSVIVVLCMFYLTASAIAHVLQIIDKKYGIKTGSVTTLHPWLSYQNLVDGGSKGTKPDINKFTPQHITSNYGLARSSVGALIPKDTTAVSATEKVLESISN